MSFNSKYTLSVYHSLPQDLNCFSISSLLKICCASTAQQQPNGKLFRKQIMQLHRGQQNLNNQKFTYFLNTSVMHDSK